MQHGRRLRRSLTGPRNLGEEVFPCFAPFLVAAQVHARQSGFRFSIVRSCETESGIDPDVIAAWRERVQAAADAVTHGEATVEQASLMAEFQKACDVIVAESVRNAMINTCKELELFPPPPLAKELAVDEKDCAYEDCTAPLPVIAQRLYNDSEQRLLYGECEGRAQQKIQLLTSLFITDFAEDAHVATPPLSPTAQSMLSDFAASVADWTAGNAPQNSAAKLLQRVKAAFANGLAMVAEGILRACGVLAALFKEVCRIFATCEGRFSAMATKAGVAAADIRKASNCFAASVQTKASDLRATASKCASSVRSNVQTRCAKVSFGQSKFSKPSPLRSIKLFKRT